MEVGLPLLGGYAAEPGEEAVEGGFEGEEDAVVHGGALVGYAMEWGGVDRCRGFAARALRWSAAKRWLSIFTAPCGPPFRVW